MVERAEAPEVHGGGQDPEAATAPSGLLSDYLTRAEAARELDVSVDTLQRWETRRTGPVCVRTGRKVLYRKGAILDWLRDQEDKKNAARGRQR